MEPSTPTPAGHPSRGRRRTGTVLMALGLLLVLAAGGWQGYSWLWARHARQAGHALVVAHRHRLADGADDAQLAACGSSGSGGTAPGAGASSGGGVSSGGSGDPVAGVLSIPSLHLLAPVEEGVSDATLAVAIGHIPASVWPGTTGTAILAAHDVSYFVDIDQLATGATVTYQTPCTTYDFTVSGQQVVQSGSPLYNSAGPTLVLETCWPTNALWYTPDRLLVTATEVATTPTTRGSAAAGSLATVGSAVVAAPPRVDAPGALVGQGLTLATNDIPMGTLTEAGDPATGWEQSPGPLAVQTSSMEAFIGDLKAGEAGNTAWWSALSPGVPMPAAMPGATVVDWHQGLDVTITADGTTATAVTLQSTVTVTGGSAPGLYQLQVDEAVHAGVLSVQSWQLTPDGD